MRGVDGPGLECSFVVCLAFLFFFYYICFVSRKMLDMEERGRERVYEQDGMKIVGWRSSSADLKFCDC